MGFKPGMRPPEKPVPNLPLGFQPKSKREAEQPENATQRGAGLGFRPKNVPVNLSNGEFRISPEQVHAIGAQALEGMGAEIVECAANEDAFIAAAPSFAAEKKTLALVTNAAADFWTIARRGTEKAAEELPNYNIEMYVVSEATAAAQRQILDNLLTNGVAGVSISAIDPANSTEILNKVASQAVLFTTDSDAPKTNRVLYIGTDNVAAGGAGWRAQSGAAGQRPGAD